MHFNSLLMWRCALVVFFLFVYILIYLSYTIIPGNVKRMVLFRTNGSAKSIVFSDDEIFKTVLKIRERNCHTLNRYEITQNKSPTDCKMLAECNQARGRTKQLPTDCDHRLPRAIIIGTYKSGTRELIDFLAMHPGIVIKNYPYYEISFFSSSRWIKGFHWYKMSMPFSLNWQITMEKSPSYFISKHSPGRIKLMNSNIKLILLVRNPVERVISQWTFRGELNLTLASVKDKIRNLHNKGDQNSALRSSVYDLSFENYLKRFNRSQIHIVDSEQLKKDPFAVLHSIESFLDLPHCIKQYDFAYNHEKGFYCLKDAALINASTCFGNKRGRPKPDIPDLEAIKSELRQLLEPHNKRFYNISGINFHWE